MAASLATFGNVMAPTTTNLRVRRDIWTLKPDDPIIVGYRRAVEVMKARKPENVASWSYQAAIHGRETRHNQRLWNQCQHFGWYFLPWHRMYTLASKRSCGKRWGKPPCRGLGTAVLELRLRRREPDAAAPVPRTDGEWKPNPLYVKEARGRHQLRRQNPGPRGVRGRGLGPAPLRRESRIRRRRNRPGTVPGADGRARGHAHGSIHNAVGGLDGNPYTAAQDPIFWLHHSNIDRLWTVWNATAGHTDPTQRNWLTQQFELFDVKGDPVKLSCESVRDYEGSGLRLLDRGDRPASADRDLRGPRSRRRR